MSRIKQLAPEEIQKIAAGEVIERPANVVKELIENSLDAGADSLTLYIEEGGKKLIRIIDNGHGMSKPDAHACILHHATSKITTVHDLESLRTFGFRGEGLSSISSVSTMVLITKEETPLEGVKVTIQNGQIHQTEITACTTGTDISIANLFDNVPVRKKFLKTKETEWRAIHNLFQAFCLAYPQHNFKLYHEGKLILNCPTTTDLQTRIGQLFDKTFVDALILEQHQDPKGSFTIDVAFCKPTYLRYDRSSLFFFVNNRWVKNQKLSQAIVRGYLKTLTPGRFPAAAVFITIDPTLIDINVHPRKEEVLFLHPRTIEIALESTIQRGLEQHYITQESTFFSASSTHSNYLPLQLQQSPYAPSTNHYPQQQISSQKFGAILDEAFTMKQDGAVSQFEPKPPFLKQAEINHLSKEFEKAKQYKIIGQLYNTYILLETEHGLTLVDQHAAHERILYELFTYRFEEVSIVKLLFPIVITLAEKDCDLLIPYQGILKEVGLHVEIVSSAHLTITATPVYYKDQSVQDIIMKMVGWIQDLPDATKANLELSLREKLRAQMACKAAVKAGDNLTLDHMQELIAQLEQTKNKFSCPHGRPTTWIVTHNEIERKFKRS
ncbi:MAG TPA: DNA mismatch repair endonuclease MutL [Candidatus Babeliaceae bacterium]|nr:DNA mismatch repair endonuclease MutL [Candidatus Babeliaceae bacterium]